MKKRCSHFRLTIKKIKMKKPKKKTNWFNRQLGKVQLLPWYWKVIATIVIFFLGGTFGTQLFTSASDLSLFLGFAILVVTLWLLIQMWFPKK